MIKPDKTIIKIIFYISLIIIGLLLLILVIASSKNKEAGSISIFITAWVLFCNFLHIQNYKN